MSLTPKSESMLREIMLSLQSSAKRRLGSRQVEVFGHGIMIMTDSESSNIVDVGIGVRDGSYRHLWVGESKIVTQEGRLMQMRALILHALFNPQGRIHEHH